MEAMEVGWVDEQEWQEIEAAVAAAVQQRCVKVCQGAVQDEAQASRKRQKLQRHSAEESFSEAQRCSAGGAGLNAEALGTRKQESSSLKLIQLGRNRAPSNEQVSVRLGQLSSSDAPSCSQCPPEVSAISPQQVLPQAASLSEWVPSQQDFGGFWAQQATAGTQHKSSGDPPTSASLQTHEKLCSEGGCKPGVFEEQSDKGTMESSAVGSQVTVQELSITSQIQPLEGSSQAVEAKTQSRNKRQLPAWLTSPKPPGASEECTLPVMRFEGSIVYAVSPVEVDCCARALLEDLKGKEACLGFDIEWKVTFRKGEVPNKAALIQLCPSASCCYLFHIVHSGITSALRTLLEDDSIGKAGAGIYGDAHKLRRDFILSMGGLRDLSDLANERLQAEEGPRKWSLSALAQEAMSMQVEKPPKQRISDWERLPLSADQQHYAATDAFASLRLYQVLMSLPAPPPRPILRPLPQSEVKSLACSGHVPVQELWLPAVVEPAYLAPSKMDVHRLHSEGLRADEIAEKKRVRITTVEGYLVEAMQAGLTYAWHRLGVSDVVRERVEEAVQDELRSAEELQAEEERTGLPPTEHGFREADGERCSSHPADPSRPNLNQGLAACGIKLREEMAESEDSQRSERSERRAVAGDVQLSESNASPSRESGLEPTNESSGACVRAEPSHDVILTSGDTHSASQRQRLRDESSAGRSEASLALDRRARNSAAKEMVEVVFTAEKLRGLKLRALKERIPPEDSVTFSQVKLVVTHLIRIAEAEASRQKRTRLIASI